MRKSPIVGNINHNNNKTMTEIQMKQLLVEDAMILMAGDMFQKVYDLPNHNDYVLVKDIIKSWAREFVKQLDWQGEDDERDWFMEMENFEDAKFKELADWNKDDKEYKQVIDMNRLKQALEENGLNLEDEYGKEVLYRLAEMYGSLSLK